MTEIDQSAVLNKAIPQWGFKEHWLNYLTVLGLAFVVGNVSHIAGQGILLLLFLYFLVKGMAMEYLFCFIIVLFFSDSRSQLFTISASTKPILALLLAVIPLGKKLHGNLSMRFMFGLLPFYLIAWIGLLYSPTPVISLQKLLSFTIVPSCTLYILGTLDDQKRHFFFRSIINVGLFFLVAGLVLAPFAQDFTYLNDRYRGLLGNPNGLGIYGVLLFLLIQMYRKLYPDQPLANKKWVVGVVVVALIYSGSRSALMALFIFYLFNYLINLSSVLSWFIFFLLAFTFESVVAGLVQLSVSLGLAENFRTSSVDEIKSGSGRAVAWQFAWQEIKKNIFLGKGYVYSEYLFDKNSTRLSILGHQGHTHNAYLAFWLDTGIVGLVLFFVPIIRWFLLMARFLPMAVPVLYCVMFSSNYESWITASLNPFTILFFIIIGLIMYSVQSIDHE